MFDQRSLIERLFALSGSSIGLYIIAALIGTGLAISIFILMMRRLTSESPLPRIALGTFVVVTLFAPIKFHFKQDDFFYLTQAMDVPWEVDGSLRLLSVTALYRVGVLLGGGVGFFIAANVIAHCLAVFLLFLLLLRANCTRDESLLAAALFGLAHGQLDLLLHASGFQITAALVVIFAVLLIVDAALRDFEHGADRADQSLISLACVLAAAGTLVKYPVTVFIPMYCWTWMRFVRQRTTPRAVLGSLAAAVFVPLMLVHPWGSSAGELGKAGISRIISNLSEAGFELTLAFVQFALLVFVLTREEVKDVPSDRADTQRSSNGFVVASVARAIFHELRISPFRWLALLAVFPFLLNRIYFASYYLMPALAWLAVIESRVLLEFTSHKRIARWALVVGAVLMAPLGEVASNFFDPFYHRQQTFLAAISRVGQGIDAPEAIEIVSKCADAKLTDETQRSMSQLMDQDGRAAIRWATGWHRTLVLPDEHSPSATQPKPVLIYYCADGTTRVEVPPHASVVDGVKFVKEFGDCEGRRYASNAGDRAFQTTPAAPLRGYVA